MGYALPILSAVRVIVVVTLFLRLALSVGNLVSVVCKVCFAVVVIGCNLVIGCLLWATWTALLRLIWLSTLENLWDVPAVATAPTDGTALDNSICSFELSRKSFQKLLGLACIAGLILPDVGFKWVGGGY